MQRFGYDTTQYYSEAEARIIGYFYGNGECINYTITSFIKRRYWLLKNLTNENVNIYLNLCKEVYPSYEWISEKVSVHLPFQSSFNENEREPSPNDRYILYPKYKHTNVSGETLKTFIKKYNFELYAKTRDFPECNEGECGSIVFRSGNPLNKKTKIIDKIVPKHILTATYEVRQSFWKGVMDSRAFIEKSLDKTVFIFECKTQLSSSHLCSFISSIDYGICSIISSCLKHLDIPEKYEITIYKKTENDLEYSQDMNDHIREIDVQTKMINQMIPIQNYNGFVYDLTTENNHFAAGIGNMIVHNTDSVFFTFNLENTETKEKIRGKDALEITIEIAQDAAKLCSQWLKSPMELSYEKTLMPFILLSKKRYVGMLYETNPDKGYMKYMGLSIKRRDSCDYLKDVYGGILNILINEHNILKSIDFLDDKLANLIDGTVTMDKLMMSKSLRSDYKNPSQIAHKVLADRIAEREPGNKPKPGDRIKFVHFVNKNGDSLQGEKIETPEFIIGNRLPIDYSFYITNQLMKPIQQLYGLAVEQILELRGNSTKTIRKELADLEQTYGNDLEVFSKKREKLCSQYVKRLLFDKYLIQINNENNGIKFDIMTYFAPSNP
jgi:hypothetical protein